MGQQIINGLFLGSIYALFALGYTLVFGVLLGVAATLVLGLAVNWLSAALALTANLFYVFVYTMVLKRRTSQNIVWGGAETRRVEAQAREASTRLPTPMPFRLMIGLENTG